MVTELNKQVEPNRNFFKIVFIYLLSESNNEEGKIKNTITRGFELQDHKIDGTELYGFWADLLSKEGLIVEVNYSPAGKESFSPEEMEEFSSTYAENMTALRLSFRKT